jgi:hypothetical protein
LELKNTAVQGVVDIYWGASICPELEVKRCETRYEIAMWLTLMRVPILGRSTWLKRDFKKRRRGEMLDAAVVRVPGMATSSGSNI